MSADKRKQILIVFAGLAVVLVGVIAYVSPNFRNEDVSGAIGAVQKHREPQIQPQDVVLGDEKVKQEGQVLYADFLTDAAALRSLSVDASVASRDAEANIKLRDVENSLAARKKDLNRRFAESMSESLVEAKKLYSEEDAEAVLGRKKLDVIVAEADALGRAVREQEQLASDDDMQALSVRLSAMVASLGSWDIKSNDTTANRVNSLKAQSLAMRVRHQAEYAAAIVREARVVAHAEELLASEETLAARKNASAVLAKEAAQLEMRAFRNMEAQAASEADLAAELARMISLASADEQAESRTILVAAQSELQTKAAPRHSYQLALFDLLLQAREALNPRLANAEDEQLAKRIRNDEGLALMRKHLGRMSVESRSVQVSALEQRASSLVESRKR